MLYWYICVYIYVIITEVEWTLNWEWGSTLKKFEGGGLRGVGLWKAMGQVM